MPTTIDSHSSDTKRSLQAIVEDMLYRQLANVGGVVGSYNFSTVLSYWNDKVKDLTQLKQEQNKRSKKNNPNPTEHEQNIIDLENSEYQRVQHQLAINKPAIEKFGKLLAKMANGEKPNTADKAFFAKKACPLTKLLADLQYQLCLVYEQSARESPPDNNDDKADYISWSKNYGAVSGSIKREILPELLEELADKMRISNLNRETSLG